MARFALIGLFSMGLMLRSAKADEATEPAPAEVVIPPALATERENADQRATGSTEEPSSLKTHVEPVPLPVPEAAEAVVVPLPNEGTEVIIQEGGTLQSNTADEEEDIWPKSLDFAHVRWWPGQGGMEWIPGHRDRFGMFSLTGESINNWESWEGVSSTSGMGFHFLNGPVSSDLPARLFDFSWGLHWGGEMMPGLTASLSAKAGLYTDFEDSVRDGWRFPAHAVLFHDVTDTIQTVFGVEFFDRENLQALPVVGLILRPDERVRVEAVFPEPRLAWQISKDEESEQWLSVSGQIGGGEWAIERSNTDRADVVTYNDYGLVFGFHGYTPGRREGAFEIGYLFARDLEYRSGVGDFEPDNTFFLRMSSRY